MKQNRIRGEYGESRDLPRYVFFFVAFCAVAVSAQSARRAPSPAAPFRVVEASIADMQAAMRAGRLTSR